MPNSESIRPYDYLYTSLEAAILSRELKPGDKLPPERSLGTTYNVSRPTVREALRALEQRGLIEIRQGAAGGSFVKAISTGKLRTTLIDLVCQGGVSYLQLLEFREPIEICMVGYAAQRASQEDIDMLKKEMRVGCTLAGKGKLDNRELYIWEGNMHLAVARIAQNPLFEWLAGTLAIENQQVHDWSLLEKMWDYDPEWLSKVYRDWQEIIKAIERRESMSAQMVMRCHLGWAIRALKAVQAC
jgi:GntR family transcriptional regulator, transcriptional repressor for pyruvate dehydrogenase complex